MTRETLLIVLGICVLLSPFLGVPGAWLIRIDVLLGLAVAYIGYTLRPKKGTLTNDAQTRAIDTIDNRVV